jgi:tetratricopeptide (TPR) repeat protein
MSYYGEQLYTKAIPHLIIASQNDPSNPELHYVLAESCLHGMKPECSLSESQKLLQLDPNSAEAHLLLGEALDGTKQEDEAIAEFNAAKAANSLQPNVHFGLGYLYWKKHDYDQAAPEFKEEIEHDPKNAQSYTYLGDIAYRNNNDDEARISLLKAVQLQPNIDWPISTWVASMLARTRTQPLSRPSKRQSVSISPSQMHITVSRASIWPQDKSRRPTRNFSRRRRSIKKNRNRS